MFLGNSNDIEVFSSVVISNEDGDSREELAKFSQYGNAHLTQVRKHKPESGRRIVLIKAVLPQGTNSGIFYVHSESGENKATLAEYPPGFNVYPTCSQRTLHGLRVCGSFAPPKC